MVNQVAMTHRVRDRMPAVLPRNQANRGDGLAMLRRLGAASTPLVFLDPQYRALLDKMDYGNDRSPRTLLPQMDLSLILDFRQEVARVLRPGGYLMQWTDKLEGFSGRWKGVQGTTRPGDLSLVDVITWRKPRWGNGYRSRRVSEYLLILQKHPKGIKTWTDHGIHDVWDPDMEKEERQELYAGLRERTTSFEYMNWKQAERKHPHLKPLGLQARLIASVTRPRQLVVDPCAGGYSVLEACRLTGRQYLGCDLRG